MIKGYFAGVVIVIGLHSAGANAWPLGFAQGAMSCGEYITASDVARSNGDPSQLWGFMAWASGFLTASFNWEPTKFGGADTASARLWLDNYCRSNPLNIFGLAVSALAVELNKR
ncbi:hypothetical protein HX886_34715 [Pseudomonas gingeri]|uniref:Uncharacterized protein n=1 Tax=Pseudomonas gingeri TaxID=117681 RepID=A0A7Y7YKI9_9PSED|nr:hypothetical protein [Pseudomonas gingeri]NWC37501.1 hypothetical protein [Pseudomonas gingeri]